jgi:putative transposase
MKPGLREDYTDLSPLLRPRFHCFHCGRDARSPALPETRGGRACVLRYVQAVRELYPFRLLAYAVLPDHFHWLMRVDDAEGNFSRVLHSVKRNFTWNYKKAHGIAGSLHAWQDRFWDHVVRSPLDLHRHFDYIHWNPVKRGYVQRPEDWPHSTYRHWLDMGYYDVAWKNVDVDALMDVEFE